ncbi:DUF2335 domain-containing protein [Negadavirga shengliensis]|uniref:DUF2335 domain-containing protein n=1 Tax=Negadavirga shengliensis TaxID=1389218 RepID=A0ABV9SVL6_9BACT
MIRNYHSGPLPTPETLNEYNLIITNGADRIMQMAELEQKHRHAIENRLTRRQLNQSFNGQIFGLIIALTALYVGFQLVMHDYETAGAVLLGSTIVSLVALFVIGRKLKS